MTSPADHRDGDELDSGWLGTTGRVLGVCSCLAILAWPTSAELPVAAQRLAAVAALMAIFWVTQALPIAVTSLLPLVLFPVFGIEATRKVAGSYLDDSSFLYLGGFILAIAIERWGLHRRISLAVLVRIGASPERLVLGFVLTTAFISMWISNTATTLMMLPIALSVLRLLEDRGVGSSAQADSPPTVPLHPREPDLERRSQHPLSAPLILGVAYAASIGGMATLVGTPTNVAFVKIWRAAFPDQAVISAAQWMLVWTPFALIFCLVAWRILCLGLPRSGQSPEIQLSLLSDELKRLGPLKTGERWILIIFGITALLWLTRTDLDLGIGPRIPGWQNLASLWLAWWGREQVEVGDWFNDATVAMAAAICTFIIPVERDLHGRTRYLMDWRAASAVPWGVMFLFGGGFALAEAFRSTGLSAWTGQWLATAFQGQPAWLVLVSVVVVLTFLTEFTTNVATVNALLPILAGLAGALGYPPALLLIPATVATSNGFMMPTGTPPNALAYATGRVRIQQMVGYGLALNLVGAVLCSLFGWFWLPLVMR